MEYRGVEYTIVQGIERGTWKWTVLLGKNISKSGQAIGKPEAAAQATRVISKALAPKGCALSRSFDDRNCEHDPAGPAPKIIGKQTGGPPLGEADHFWKCETCGFPMWFLI